ncbi:putative RNA-directed DNA polymerase from transposon X-element [Trichonephila inaurata madagascariensis]|uniref:Putative RNA-directed DNA polymerase from transposon X-element n=1 Tax=Trichonephila inaurata madagascariensis TaxID=2747483 RepID=A0A8X6JVS0_9ARAC|nr:putative RNA-directed DNA polymerase from transposon X-element [Trichonephila inaurata madagascariensis]
MLVTKIVDFISSQALNKRKFDALLDENNSVYNGLLMYNNVRWLSHGNVFQKFADRLEEIRLILQNESKIEQYPQLMDITSFITHWNPDIVNLQETHLQPCHNFTFPDYNIYRTDRTYRGGGTAIMIKRSIPHHQIIINNNSFETTAIKLNRQNDLPVTIVSAYRPPRKPIAVQDLHQIFRNQGHVLVAGDLNAKHASWSPLTQQNTPGNIIRRFCDSTGYSLNAPPEPTCFRRSYRSTTIDIAICKGMTVTDYSSISELSSDHNPVLFEVSLDNFTSPALVLTLFLTGTNSRKYLLTPYQEIQEFPTQST